MDDYNKFERVSDPLDPRRCQGNDARGQCQMVAVEGSSYCMRHGGSSAIRKREQTELRNLKLTKFKARLAQLGSSPDLMSLRDEIAVTRMTLEEVINQCEGPTDLITYSGQIAALVGQTEKLVKSCHSIEEKTGHLLSRDALSNFAGQVIDIVIKYVSDEEARRSIAGEIVDAVANGTGDSQSD
jgi:hypothetical protein